MYEIFDACERGVTHSSLYTHQVARAGRFGTKGLAITFVSDETDAKTLNDVQDRFEVNVAELPDEIDISSYSKSFHVCCWTAAEMQWWWMSLLKLPSWPDPLEWL